ncbi:hypothetical protein OROHE_025275 [Orobanche hederae]
MVWFVTMVRPAGYELGKPVLPDFMGTDPVGWITVAEEFIGKNEIHPCDMLQWAFMSMETEEALLWFYSSTQENIDADWKTFSIVLGRRFGKRNYGVVEERLIEEDESNTQVLSEKRNGVDPNAEVSRNGYENQILCSGANCNESMAEFGVAAKTEGDRTRVSVTENHKMVEAVDTPPPSG